MPLSSSALTTNTSQNPNLLPMKDFCMREQVFFNEGDRITFLKERSKNHYKLYKDAFDGSTNNYMVGDKRDQQVMSASGRRKIKVQSSE